MALYDGTGPTRSLDAIEQEVVARVGDRGSIGSREILEGLMAKGVKVSFPTLARRLDRLVQERHLLREGQGRATRYRIDPYHSYFDVPPTRRKPVGYDSSILAGYEPNKTRWITPAESAELERAGGGRHVDASSYTRAITQKLLVDLSYASSVLEGNTYTYLDTEVLIQFGEAAQGKDRDETVMILNHKNTIAYLLEFIADITVTPREIKTIHGLLSQDLNNMDPRDVGAVRHSPIDGIGGSAYKPLAIPMRIEEELNAIASKAVEIHDPFEQSLFLMTMVSYLQAFRDVNKRTGRLACNIPLLKSGLAPMSFLDMDKAAYVRGLLTFYELGRTDLIKGAYIEGYLKTAARYDAYVGRPKEVLDIEFKRRKDVAACVREYVLARTTTSDIPQAPEFAASRFAADTLGTQKVLTDRVAAIVESLGEGNHLAYGISRAEFDSYREAIEGDAPLPPGSR